MNIHNYNKQLITDSIKNIYPKLISKKFLISGGTGYLGKNLIYTINLINMVFDTNIEIDIVCRKKRYIFKKDFKFKKKVKINYLYCDLSKHPPIYEKTYDIVIHLANNSVFDNVESDIVFKNYKNFVSNLKNKEFITFILLSSGSVYQQNKNKILKESASLISKNSKNKGYDKGKLLTELDVLKKEKLFKKIIILRGFTFIGQFYESNSHFFISQLLNAIKKNKKIFKISSDGSICRSYLYAIDAAIIIIKSIFYAHKNIYNLGSNEYLKIKDIDKIIKNKLHKKIKFQYLDVIPKPYDRGTYLPNINNVLKHFKIKKLTKLESSVSMLLKVI